MMDLKLDTLNKKPKVYNIAVLTAAVALIWALMLVLGGLRMLAPGCLLLCGYALAVSVLLIRAFFLQMRYNLYSYNTIIYRDYSLRDKIRAVRPVRAGSTRTRGSSAR